MAIGHGAISTINQYGDIIIKADNIEDLPPAPGEPPYKGLAYFTEADEKIYFGREKLSNQLVNRLRKTRFLALIGASGSGKSSLLRAGLIPRLRARNWQIHVFKPGALAQSLQANSRALIANEPNNQELAQARLLAIEGAEVNDRFGSAVEKSSSAGLLLSLGYEQPIPYQAETTLSEHTDSVWSVAWNGDGSRLASASCGERGEGVLCNQGEVVIWDTASWEPVTTLSEHTDSVSSVAWNGDGSRLASASDDSTVIIWKFPDFSLLQCQLAGRNLSLAEWEEFLPGVDYRCTCAEWPAGDDAPLDAPGCSKTEDGLS